MASYSIFDFNLTIRGKPGIPVEVTDFRSTVVRLHDGGYLKPCILDHPILGSYARELLTIDDDDFYGILEDMRSAKLHGQFINFRNVSNPIPFVYALVAVVAYRQKVEFQYDDSFYDFINRLSRDLIIHILYLIDCIIEDTTGGSEKFLKSNIIHPYLEKVSELQENTSYYESEMKQCNTRENDFFFCHDADVEQALVHKAITNKQGVNYKRVHCGERLSWILNFDHSPSTVAAVVREHHDKIDIAAVISSTLDFITLCMAGLVPYSHRITVSLQDYLSGLIQSGIDCDSILKLTVESLPKQQAASVIVPLSRQSGRDFAFNRLQLLTSIIQIPRAKLEY